MITHDIALGSRVGPALNTALILTGVWIGSPAFFLALVPFALVGVIWKRHPVDVIYSELVAPIIHSRPIPKCGTPRRFASGLAAVWLVLLAIVFRNGPTLTGGLLAGLMAAGTFMTATLDLCLPCSVYTKLFVRRTFDWEDAPTIRRDA
jgi:hypothetical protein